MGLPGANSWLYDRISDLNCPCTRPAGMGPVSWFRWRSSDRRFGRSAKDAGIRPLSLLLERSTESRLRSLARDSGMGPDTPVWEMVRNWSLESAVRQGGMAPVRPGRRKRDRDMSSESPATEGGICPRTSEAPSMKTLLTRPASSQRRWSHAQQLGDDAVHVDSVAGLPSDCFMLSSACRSLGAQDIAGVAAYAATSRRTARKEVVAVDAIVGMVVVAQLVRWGSWLARERVGRVCGSEAHPRVL
nr:unnamed protein product [Digitaria exilis]